MTKEAGVLVIDDQVELVGSCPRRFAEKYVHETYPWNPSINMLEGLYGETKLLGSSARGQAVHDLPKKQNGENRVSQDRIDIQMQRMEAFMMAHGVDFNDNTTQVRLLAQYRPKVWLRGEMDIFPAEVHGQTSIVDLKTTKDVENTFFSIEEKYVHFAGNSCWGKYPQIIKNQPLFYHFLARNFYNTGLDMLKRFNPEDSEKYEYLFDLGLDYSDVNFWFFVAGIGKPDYRKQLKAFEYPMTDHRKVLLDAVIENSVIRIRDFINSNFEERPSKALCRDCALKDVCDSYSKVKDE